MTDPVSIVLTVAAAAVAGALAWLEVPRPPDLDGERWFKIALCTLLRGRVESAGGGVEAWEAEVLRVVPYHPAGRLPERKVANPIAAQLPGAALEGELALIEALAKRTDVSDRLGWMYDQDPLGVEARFSDPNDLGPDYAFGAFGPGASWDALAAWGAGADGFLEAARRAVRATWVLVEGRPGRLAGPSVLDALAAELGDAVRIPHGEPGLAERLRNLLTDSTVRLVLVGEEAGVADLLDRLVDDTELRDQVSAVVSIGGVIGGRADEPGPYSETVRRDWLQARFGQRDLDTDVVRLTPYLAVQWLDRTAWPVGVPGLPLQASRFPEPHTEGASATTVEVVDLGPLWADRPPPLELVARALIAVVTGWIASRR